MDKICLDTDFLIDFLRKDENAVSFLDKNEGVAILATTYVNLFELYNGAYQSERPALNLPSIEALKGRLQLLNLSQESVKLAGEVFAELGKRGELIEIRDLFIGTIAVINNFSVKTNNVRHFKKIPNLRIL